MSDGQSFCTSCGHALGPGCAFCVKCGAAIASGRPADAPLLPPRPDRPSPTNQGQALAPTAGKGGSWLLPLVGGALVLVLMGVGLKLLGQPSGPAKAVIGPTPDQNSATSQPVVESSSQVPKADSEPDPATVVEPPAQEQAVSETKPPVEEDIPGIVELALDQSETYLPYPRSRYRHSMKYPDGDHGHREMVVASSDAQVLTTLEFTHSALYPDDPPGLWVNHYVFRPDGIYRYSDDDPYRAELWLPNDLKLGKTWKSALGEFEIVAFDQEITVNGTPYKGVLAYRQRSSEVGIDQTIWLAPGHGELKGCYGEAGEEFFRLLHVESEPESKIETLMKRHVRNLDKIK
jgi:hypothetical protein